MVPLEKALGIAIEPDVGRWLHARPALLSDANWFYSQMDETLVFGVLATLRLLDDVRFAAIRTAFSLTHLPAIVVVAVYPSAPPRWVPGLPKGRPPTADFSGDVRKLDRRGGEPPRGRPDAAGRGRDLAPAAIAAGVGDIFYPLLVFAVVVGTAKDFILDVAIGAGCAALSIAGARLVHGEVPRVGLRHQRGHPAPRRLTVGGGTGRPPPTRSFTRPRTPRPSPPRG